MEVGGDMTYVSLDYLDGGSGAHALLAALTPVLLWSVEKRMCAAAQEPRYDFNIK